ncbi:MAG: glutathione S-transferase family protein [Myxococcota bacterium]
MASTTPQEAVLYQFSLCPFCHKVRAGLELKGIPYRTVEVNPRSKTELPPLPAGAPQKVPVLQVGDRTVFDSTTILNFLDEAYPETRRFNPEDAAQRKQSDDIEAWVDDEFIRSLPTVIYGTWGEAAQAARLVARSSNFGVLQGLGMKLGGSVIMHLVAKRILKKSGQADAHAWVGANLDKFEGWLGTQDFVCGAELSLADVAMVGAINCVREFPIYREIMRRPVLAGWFSRMEQSKEQAAKAA